MIEFKTKRETTMNRYLPVFAALAVSLTSSAFVPSLKASEFDRKTIITISHPVAVEDTILPAGQYVLRLLDTPTRDVVYIFNGEETRLIKTVLAIHAERSELTGKSDFSFYDSSAGQPAALRTWFYPGDETGFEFLPPQHMAAANSNATLGATRKAPARSSQPMNTPTTGAGAN
jgi:hypothetical protein